MDAHIMPMMKGIGIFVGLLTFSLAGFTLYFNSKVREISALWHKNDLFNDELQDLQVRMVEKFATKSEVSVGLDRMRQDIRDLRGSVEALRRDLKDS